MAFREEIQSSQPGIVPNLLDFLKSGVFTSLVPEYLPEPAKRKVMCYPIQLCILSPPGGRVEHQTEGETTFLRYKGEMHKINTTHFLKLVCTRF
jgi:hypothetical protein